MQLRPATVRPEEQAFADLADRVPSSAGFYVDQAGRLTVWVHDTSEAAQARSVVSGVLASRFPTQRPAVQTVTRRADYTFWQLAAFRDKVFDNVFGVEGLITLDLNEQTNRVVIGIDRARFPFLRNEITRKLVELEVDTNAVVFRESHLALSTGRVGRARTPGANLQSSLDTLVGGVLFTSRDSADVAALGTCTIGAIVDYSGSRGFLTASHCSQTEFSVDGAVAHQASNADHRVAFESADPSGYTCVIYPFQRACRGSDASIFALDAGIYSSRGLIAKTTYASGQWPYGPGSSTWDTSDPYFIITGTANSFVSGALIEKVGSRTGWTWGYVIDTCVDIDQPGGHKITCAESSSIGSNHGDSGSPVFQPASGDVEVTLGGVLFALDSTLQASYFSPWGRIVSDLGSMSVSRGISLSTPSLGGYVSSNSPVITWSSVSGATRYHIYRDWYNYDTGTGSNGFQYLGTGSSAYLDLSAPAVNLYTGGTKPGIHDHGYVSYYIFAANITDFSANSSFVYFRLKP